MSRSVLPRSLSPGASTGALAELVTSRLAALATRFETVAEELTTVAAATGGAEASAWHGPAGEAYRLRVVQHREAISALAGQYRGVAHELRAAATVLGAQLAAASSVAELGALGLQLAGLVHGGGR